MVASYGNGYVALPECCRVKLTPGTTCQKMDTCHLCSLTKFCHWIHHGRSGKCESTYELSGEELAMDTQQRCEHPTDSYFGEEGAYLLASRPPEPLPQASTIHTETPKIIFDHDHSSGGGWPGQYDGILRSQSQQGQSATGSPNLLQYFQPRYR